MLAIGFRFLAGRYHANPWGRHVNEADIEWPPAPWRVCRALISTWYHKADHQQFTFGQLEILIDVLSETQPVYELPPAVHTHTRHYMPQWKGNTSLVFDAFARVNPQDELVMAWPELELAAELGALLDDLLHKLGYLGRAESWVEARRLPDEELPETFQCRPGENPVDTDTGEIVGEVVRLLAPQSHQTYQRWRQGFVGAEISEQKGKKKKLLQQTSPESLTRALCLDTSELQKAGWSQPPAGTFVNYLRPVDCLRPKLARPKTHTRSVTTARFMLVGKPRPRIEDAVRIGERFRAALMGKAKYVLDGENNIPSELSGHNLGQNKRHDHAFYLPEDADADGRIDHILLHASGGLSAATQRVLARFNVLRGRQGREWQVILEGVGTAGDFYAGSRYIGEDVVWQSVTPYLHPWFAKKRFTLEDQIRRECRERGLIEPARIECLESVTVKGRARRVIHFHRFRNKRGLTQPDTRGSFLRLYFSQPLNGPLALGFGCHFGLGLFHRVTEVN
ncbi:MAG TPA: type I-U CRISPR-associated protein Cas5/Cas6 [Gammaproteobacteria bacterium]|nr:type I-U CRISPR-associated protein Cas5/Cas6 [Gammaproteobacteria bacterium]